MRVVAINAPTVEGRERRWQVAFPHGDEALLVNYLVLEEGEEVDDSPPEERMTIAEFKRRCGEFGLTPNGKPIDEGRSP